MIVYDSQGKLIRLGEAVGRGGEATVYHVHGRPDSLAKIYSPAPRPTYPAKLAWMIAHPPENPTQAQRHASLAWPSGQLFDGKRRMVGYLMPHVQVAAPLLEVFNPRRRQVVLPQFNRLYLHRVARNLAAALGALHSRGYIVGDLNESNALVTPSALVTLIDTDSFQVQELREGGSIVHYCPVGKLEYTPPELQGRPLEKVLRLPEHDAFALGVLVFQILMEGNHPFRAQWQEKGEPLPLEERIRLGYFPYTATPLGPVAPPKNAPALNLLHPTLAELARRCFVDGFREPAARPTPAQWESAVAEAEGALVICSNTHRYSNHLPACPVCGALPLGKKPAIRKEAFSWPGSPAPRSQSDTLSQPGSSRPSSPQPASTSQSAAPPSGSYRPSAPRPPSLGTTQRVRPAPRAGPAPGSALGGMPTYTTPRWPFPSPSRSSPASAQAPLSSAPASVPAASAPAAAPAAAFPGPWVWNRPNLPAPGWLQRWSRSTLVVSFVAGGAPAAVAGALPAALLSLSFSALGHPPAWSLLWLVGGLSGGLLRGWKPGYRLGRAIERRIGWNRFWQATGLIGGAVVGTVLGTLVGAALIFPIFLGMLSGARGGAMAGKRLWLAGARYGWERIWALVGAANAAFAGAVLARLVASGFPGDWSNHLALNLAAWLMGQASSWPLVWIAVGALGGAFGGWAAGFLIDLSARLLHLSD